MLRPLAALATTLALAGPAAAQSDRWVWWEGEAPARTNFANDTWLAGDRLEHGERLSGGAWLNHDGVRRGEALFAVYRVEVPSDGTYALWTRKFWKHGPFRWRLDDGAWRTCGRDVALADSVGLREHVVANWVHLGEVDLAAGEHALELRLLAAPGEKALACFDAFLLTRDPFTPRGQLQPGETTGRAAPGWWAFEPAPDRFGDDAVLDLRRLNEARAGAAGPVRRAGDGFVRGDGEPIRFWGVNVGPDVVRLDAGSVRSLTRRLAKAGVNLVRIHGRVWDPERARAGADPAYVDRVRAFVAACAEAGIYSALSFYFPLWTDGAALGFDDLGDGARPFGLIFWDEELQAIYRRWAAGLLTRAGPDGPPLAEDPAVAMVELVNEDSLFFWTFEPADLPAPRVAELEAAYTDWLTERHGSLAAAREAWGAAADPRDRPDRAALRPAWHMTADGLRGAADRRRMSDQVRFLTGRQRAFYARTTRWLREELDVGCPVVASNWKTADPRLLDGLERYTYAAADVMDRHGYFVGRHEGPRASYQVNVGDRFADRAGVLEPEALPLAFDQVAGFPQITSELGWPNPNRFKAELPVLTAAYGALQGLDGVGLFAVGGPSWATSVRKFPVMIPTVLGQSPACALLFRRGDVEEAPPVFAQTVPLADLYALRGQAAVAPQALDALRAGDARGAAARAEGGLDPLAFYCGRVVRAIDAPARVERGPLDDLIDRDARVVTSVTEQLRWDYGRGLVTIDTPRTQGALGFLGRAGRIDLTNASIDVATEFGAVLLTSLDGAPLPRSERVLVQAVTEERFHGWAVEGDAIESLGGLPLEVRRIEGTVELATWRLRRARVLDPHGYEREARRLERGGGRVRLALPEDALYTVLE